MVILTVGLLILGCGESDPNNPGNHLPTVNGGLDKTAKVSDTINLTAIGLDVDGDTLTYTWSFKSKPTGSIATLTTNNNKVSFVADKEGAYLLNVVANDGLADSSVDTVKVTVTATGMVINPIDITTCTELSGAIDSDRILSDSCYKVVNSVYVSDNALLTINPGTTLVFSQGKNLRIQQNGALKAVGTADKPIVFTAEQKTVGYWNGINFYYSNNVKNELAHIVVEYAGLGSGWEGAIHADSSSTSPSRLKIRDSVIQYSKTNGFHFDNYTIIDEFKNVTSTKNQQTAGSLSASAVGSLDSASDFSGNIGGDYVTVNGGSITVDSTWNDLTVPLFIKNSISVDNGLLTINGGANLTFGAGTNLTIEQSGALKAVGTSDNNITFTAKQKTVGYWNGINFYYSNNVKNELAHIVVEYAGLGSGWYGAIHADSSSTSPSRLKIRDSVIQYSKTHGFHFDDYTIVDEFKNVTSTKNTLTAGSLHASAVASLDSASDFSGNIGGDYVTVNGGDVTVDSVWSALSVPLFIKNSVYVDSGLLTINAGATLAFEGTNLSIKKAGSLKAVGTTTNPILFTGKQKTVGYWSGIDFYYSNNSNNEIAYATIEYGGNGSGYNGEIHVDSSSTSPSKVNIHDCTLSNSYSYGIWLDKYTVNNQDIGSVNTFTSNANGSVGTN